MFIFPSSFSIKVNTGKMNKRHVKLLSAVLIISAFMLISFSDAIADHERRSVTPYGDFCSECTRYGTCKSTLSHDKAKKAIMDYYHQKGLGVEIENKRGRFIKVKIKDSHKIVDVIIFDRRTGRLRSIY